MEIIGDAGIEIHADGSDAKQELDKVAEDRIVNYKARLLSTRDVERALTRLARDRVVNIIPKLNTAAYKRVEASLAKLSDGNLTHALERSLARLSYALEQISDKLDEVTETRKATIEADLDGSTFVRARLAHLSRPRTSTIYPKVDKKAYKKAQVMLTALERASGLRVLRDLGRNFKEMVINLDRAAPTMALVTSGMGTLVAMGGALVGWIGLAATQLATLGALLLPLPALFIGAGGAVAVLMMTLTDAAEVLKDYSKPFEDLSKVIRQNFWYEFEGGIRNLIDNALPMLRTEMGSMSTALGTFLGTMANTAGSETNISRIASVLSGTTEGINNSTKGIESWTNGLLELATVGARYLPDMGLWFTEMGERFDEWVTKNDENGNFTRWISDGLETFKVLGAMMGDLVGIIVGIGRASEEAGGGGIYTLAGALERMNEAINSESGNEKLVHFFTTTGEAMRILGGGIGDFMSSLTDDMGTLDTVMISGTTAIASLLGLLGEVIGNPAFGEGLGNLLGGANEALESLSGVSGPIAAILGAVGTAAGDLLGAMGPVLGSAIEGIAPLLTALGEGAGPIIEMLGGHLTNFIDLITPLANILAENLVPIMSTFGDILDGLVEAVWPLIESVQELLGNALEILLPVIRDLAEKYGPVLVGAFEELSAAVTPFFDVIGGFLERNGPAIMGVLEWIGGFLINTLIGAIQGISKVFRGVFDIISGVWETFAGLFTGDWSRMWEGIKGIFSGVWEALVGVVQFMMNFGILKSVGSIFKLIIGVFKNSGTIISTTFSNLWNWLVGVATKAPKAIWKFIADAWRSIISTFSNFGQTVSTLWGSLWGAVKSVASTAWGVVRDGVSGFFSTVKGLFTNFKGTVKGIWDDLWGGLKEAGEKAWTLIKDGAVSAFNKMKDAISGIWGGIKKAIGDPILAVIGFINKGVIGAYNWVAEKLNLPTIAVIPDININTTTSTSRTTGGRTAVRAFRSGGYVDMPWSATKRDPYYGISPQGLLKFEGEEFIVNRQATKRNRKLLEMINSGRVSYDHGLPKFAKGGLVNFRGHRFTALFASLLTEAEKLAGRTMHISQGGFRPRTSYSGTSHQGDAVDITGSGHQAFIAPLRKLGIPTWDRTGKGNWVSHSHGIPLPGSGTPLGSAIWQGQSYLSGGDGLGGRDNGPRGGILDKLIQGISGAVAAGYDTVMGWFSAIGDMITGPFDSFIENLSGGIMGDMTKAVATKLKEGVGTWAKAQLGIGDDEETPAYARGTLSARRGWGLVGEEGPEWVKFNGGERVLNARDTRRAETRSGNITIHHLELPGVTTWQEIERLLQERAEEKRRGYMMGANYGYSG